CRVGQSCVGAVRTSTPLDVQSTVSSLLVPVIEGFQAKAWFSTTRSSVAGTPLARVRVADHLEEITQAHAWPGAQVDCGIHITNRLVPQPHVLVKRRK